MFIGPVFSREVVIAPRRRWIYIARSLYLLSLLVLMSTAWLILTGTQLVRDLGDMARFGMILFHILAPLQLTMAVFFSGMLAASAVAQEKDRRTLILLLLTNLSSCELVLGKLLASLLLVLVLTAAALPAFMLSALLGGISFGQIARVFAVTVATTIACGSLGSTLALWREKTFQSLALTVLVIVGWIAGWEIVAAGAFGSQLLGVPVDALAAGFSPWQAILEATRPYVEPEPALGVFGTPVYLFLVSAVVISALLNGLAIAMVRVWNPSREIQRVPPEAEQRESIWGVQHDLKVERQAVESDEATASGSASVATVSPPGVQREGTSRKPLGAAPGRTRHVWDNPIIWREMRTWAYGRKVLVIRLVYLLMFAVAALAVHGVVESGELVGRWQASQALVPLFLLSLVLVNAQSVTSLTSERDGRALDLLLVTDLTPKEIVYGKMGGVFYNTKEMVLLPMLLCIYLWWRGPLSLENLFYLVSGLAVLYVFVVTLGIHSGMTYFNSRNAVATSLGTLFFLFVGVATCMRMMVAFAGSFQAQLQPFLALTIGGGIGLYAALGVRNPSTAIGVASFLCPFATFYAITSFLLDYTLGVFLVVVFAYGFTTAAMLVPAIYEFDVATGRTTIGEE